MKSLTNVLNNAVATEGFDIPVYVVVVGESPKCLYYPSIGIALANHSVLRKYDCLNAGFHLDLSSAASYMVCYVQQSS